MGLVAPPRTLHDQFAGLFSPSAKLEYRANPQNLFCSILRIAEYLGNFEISWIGYINLAGFIEQDLTSEVRFEVRKPAVYKVPPRQTPTQDLYANSF